LAGHGHLVFFPFRSLGSESAFSCNNGREAEVNLANEILLMRELENVQSDSVLEESQVRQRKGIAKRSENNRAPNPTKTEISDCPLSTCAQQREFGGNENRI
jgi:hypothetical protein